MNILLPENRSFDTAKIPEEGSEIYYCVFDYGNLDEVDYQFLPMVFIEDFAKACVELRIGKHLIQVPLPWSILISEQEFGDVELMPIIEFHGRDFDAFVFNPVSGFMPDFMPIEIINIYQEVRWCVPSMKPDQLLTVPIAIGENPPCAFFAEPKNKFPEEIDVRHLV